MAQYNLVMTGSQLSPDSFYFNKGIDEKMIGSVGVYKREGGMLRALEDLATQIRETCENLNETQRDYLHECDSWVIVSIPYIRANGLPEDYRGRKKTLVRFLGVGQEALDYFVQQLTGNNQII
jgi:hypothetical protein